MVVTPVIDRLEAVSQESSPDVAQNDQSFITLETYRAISETAEERLEYRNGEIFTMSGGTANHSAIAVNLIILGLTQKNEP